MIRVLIAEDSLLVRDSIRRVLDREPGVYVVGSACNEEELHNLLPHANLILLSTMLDGVPATAVLEGIRDSLDGAKVFVMGASEQPESILRYIEAGASGYILQNDSIDEMVGKLRAAEEGKAFISPTVAACLMARLAHLARIETPLTVGHAKLELLGELTPREEEILELISNGYTNQEIADQLVIECGTVKNHVHNILSKLDTSNRREAASIFQLHRHNNGAPVAYA
jgi:DNA-binding NarL/FixJ family response regulator